MSRQQIGNIVLPRQPPRPNMHRFDSFSLVRDSLPAHNASLSSLNIGAATPRPQGNMPNMPVIRVPESRAAETYRPALFTNHGVTESLGGSPRWEAEHLAHRHPHFLLQRPLLPFPYLQFPISLCLVYREQVS